jgi:hypothetical protein
MGWDILLAFLNHKENLGTNPQEFPMFCKKTQLILALALERAVLIRRNRFGRCLALVTTGLLICSAVASAQLQGKPVPHPVYVSSDDALSPLTGIRDLTCASPPCVLPNVQVSSNQANSLLIATNPTNSVDLLASEWAESACNGTVALTSVDDGTQWVSNCFRNLAEDGDPAIAYGRKSLYAAGATDPPPAYVQVSTNNGKTWSEPIEVTPPLLNGDTNVPWLAVDNVSDGAFKNAAYLSVTQFDNLIVESEISASHSTDEGQTWTTTTVDPVQYKPVVDQFSRMVVGKDGTVYVAWQRCTMTSKWINCADTKASMLLSKSTDGGNTWSDPVVIAIVKLVPDTCDGCFNPFFGNLPNTNEGMGNMPVLAIDNSTGKYAGNLYAAIYDWTGKQMRAEVVTSTDGGSTWGQPVPVVPATETHDQFFPTIAVSPGGVLGVGWLDRRNDPINISYQPFAAVSSNGGATFGKNYVLASNLSDPYLDGEGGGYMGDYIGASWSGNNFLVTWPDTRSMQYMQDYLGGLRIK